jgi:kinesin family protein 6/9
LKRENEELKAELAMLKGGEGKECLDETELEECKRQVEEYIRSREPGVKLILSNLF